MQETGAPYVVRGFASTSSTLGGGSGGYAVGSAPLSGYGGGGNAAGAVYGSIAAGSSVHGTPQHTPQMAAQPLPRRSLTHPDTGISNDGWDNENSDLILAVGDVLVNMSGDRCSEPAGCPCLHPAACMLNPNWGWNTASRLERGCALLGASRVNTPGCCHSSA